MLKDYVVAETVIHFHLIRAEEDVVDGAIKAANGLSQSYDTGYEAISKALSVIDADYEVMPNFCGTEIVDIEIVNEV